MMILKPVVFRRLMFAATLLCVCVLAQNRPKGQTTGPCGQNVIVCENQNAGAPASEWDVSGAGDSTIQGFATQISVIAGQLQQFKVDTTASGFTVDIYRMGYYGGMGARKINTTTISTTATNQPNCVSNAATGLVDCGNWSVSASWTVPSAAVSGIYFARFKRNDTGGASHAFFIVRESDTASTHSDMLFQTSDTTWQAYNRYGGNSLYFGSPAGRAYKVSYNRPITSRADTSGQDSPFNAEYPMVRFLEANGYDVSYISGVDTDRSGSLLLQHKVFLSVGHDEYWSGGQRANVEAARAAGVNLAFFSGNEIFWKTRWENSIDGSGTPYRTLVCYKETHDNGRTDPLDVSPTWTWTGSWADPRFSPPSDGGRPQNAVNGQMFGVNDGDTTAITIPAAFGKHRFWRNTSVATLAAGSTATMPNGTLGYEWDIDVDNGFLPPSLMRLSQTTRNVAGKLLDYGSTFGSGTVTHTMTLYRASSGALVFGAGTVQWSWGLDATHDRGSTAADVRMKQATVNLFADMGAQPATLQTGLVAATASADAIAPTSTITSPANGASFAAGTAVTISGTAADTGGGIVAGVEVSTDGGTTWRAATGTTAWTFSWSATGSGAVTLRSRAYDDTGNRETASAGVSVNITASRTCPCSIWAASVVPPSPLDDGDPGSVELGTKFRADSNGYITGVRFYKGSANTGTHTGSLWTSTGTLLGTVTFINETASGWQQASFPSPLAINANTTYIVSYHAPNGHYTGTDPYYTSAVDNAPLHALRDGTDGPNGLYAYGGATTFPTNTFNSENYWADVVFTTTPPVDTTPPTVTSTFPVASATNVDPSAPITATFSEAMDPNTISSSTAGEGGGAPGTFELRDATNNLVNASVAYDSASKTATLAPKTALAVSTTYTAKVKGGAADPRAKDLAGNALAADRIWSFTTAAAPPPPPTCPCSMWPASAVPTPVDDNDPASVELGTKFRSDIPGYVTGARFYKGSLNTGTHTASLWTSTGTRLATATFSGETASGWQQVAFPSPVQIAANTTYVISYHAPNGHYSAPDNYFATAGLDSPPLHGLKNGVDGPNGVYGYGSTSVFPNQTFSSEAYFADVIFNTTVGPDVTPPREASVSPIAGASGVRATTSVTATFNEALNASTITSATFVLKDPSNATVAATVTYSASTLTATLTPTSALAYSTLYTAVVKAGVKDLAGNATTSDFPWSFTTSAPPPPPPTEGPGGPILVVTATANPFTTYLAEILRGEGANEFARMDVAQVTATVLSNYDVVILGDMTLSPAQVSMFTTWVNGGGNLIAMRPDKQLAALMGLADTGTTLADGYLLVNTASGPGVGITNQIVQFHGTADKYTLSGATSLATLYSNATTSTPNPAVTTRTFGGGHAVAFTYDLARSVVYTRQGNPAWAGTERDGQTPAVIRPDDLFFGAKSGDVKPDYIDLNKVAIPQADEQQRLLWNIVLNANSSKTPLPRFWYFPRMAPAAVIMTGDDHANNGTAGRFDDYLGASTPNCSVDDWGCIRSTSYIYPGTPISDAAVATYIAQGFEVALHVNTNCLDWTPSTLAGFYNTQLTQFAQGWPHAPAPLTNRTHCMVWSDWSTQPQVELNNGIRLDTNYYYWPNTWILDRPGMFTGSGMPQRFASATGQMIDVYQAPTQMTDESGQTYPKNIDTLLNNATGALGYYGAFTTNMHNDANPSPSETAAMQIVNSAQSHNVPVVSAKQMLDWLDGRNGSSFQGISWASNVLTFNIAVATGANGLRALVPAVAGTSPITGILFNGAPLAYTTQTIKGVSYAWFVASAGTYQVSYGVDITAPTISGVGATLTSTTAAVTWSTNEPSDSLVSYGTNAASLTQTASDSSSVLSHSVTLSGLSPNTTYFMRVTSADASGNSSTSPATGSSPLNFTTTALSVSGVLSPSQLGAGATVSLSGPMSPITAANGSGAYSFSGLSAGSYTVTPSKTGYTFTPDSQPLTLTSTDATAVNFTAQPVVISGTISPVASGSSATVTLSGTMSDVVTADASGNYSLAGLANGPYTVTVSKSGFTFTPPSQNLTITGQASATGVNFTGQPIPTWTVSGTIAAGGGATVNLTGAATKTTTADGSGNYAFTGLLDGGYTVTPAKSGYTMSPPSQSVTVSGANVSSVGFTAQPIPTYSISGTVSPTPLGAGSTVALSGAATGTTTTDASGNYSFAGLLNGTYTVAPTKSGVIMTPTSRSVTISNANAGAVNFTASSPALSIDASVSTGRSTKATTIASAPFTTTAGNELVLALVAMDDVNANGITVTGVSGAGLTWTFVRRTNTSRGGSEIWRAFAPSVLTGVTATATLSQNVAAAMTIVTFKGADTTGTNGSGAIGATASGAAASGGPTASLTTTRAGSIVIGVGNDWDGATNRTLGPNQTLVSQFLATVGDTFWVQRTTSTITAAGTIVTINDTAPTGDQYNLTICEVLSGS